MSDFVAVHRNSVSELQKLVACKGVRPLTLEELDRHKIRYKQVPCRGARRALHRGDFLMAIAPTSGCSPGLRTISQRELESRCECEGSLRSWLEDLFTRRSEKRSNLASIAATG